LNVAREGVRKQYGQANEATTSASVSSTEKRAASVRITP
jgi:hypothetical protein